MGLRLKMYLNTKTLRKSLGDTNSEKINLEKWCCRNTKQPLSRLSLFLGIAMRVPFTSLITFYRWATKYCQIRILDIIKCYPQNITVCKHSFYVISFLWISHNVTTHDVICKGFYESNQIPIQTKPQVMMTLQTAMRILSDGHSYMSTVPNNG